MSKEPGASLAASVPSSFIFLRQRFSSLRSDPNFTTFKNFFFPDRHGSLNLLDGKSARGKRRLPMTRGNGDHHARFSDLHRTRGDER